MSACAEASDTIICDPTVDAFGERGRSVSPNQRKKHEKKGKKT
jgi:hypothetical protein